MSGKFRYLRDIKVCFENRKDFWKQVFRYFGMDNGTFV